jgi:hypothetical protein
MGFKHKILKYVFSIYSQINRLNPHNHPTTNKNALQRYYDAKKNDSKSLL